MKSQVSYFKWKKKQGYQIFYENLAISTEYSMRKSGKCEFYQDKLYSNINSVI